MPVHGVQAAVNLRPEQKQVLVPLAREYAAIIQEVATERKDGYAALIRVGLISLG